jgi:hypothetical protein
MLVVRRASIVLGAGSRGSRREGFFAWIVTSG